MEVSLGVIKTNKNLSQGLSLIKNHFNRMSRGLHEQNSKAFSFTNRKLIQNQTSKGI